MIHVNGFVLRTVFSSDIVPENISGSLVQKVVARGKRFNAIEFIFDGAVNGFDIGLPCVSGRRNGLMNKAFDGLDGVCKRAIRASIPSADEFASVVGLEAAVFQ